MNLVQVKKLILTHLTRYNEEESRINTEIQDSLRAGNTNIDALREKRSTIWVKVAALHALEDELPPSTDVEWEAERSTPPARGVQEGK